MTAMALVARMALRAVHALYLLYAVVLWNITLGFNVQSADIAFGKFEVTVAVDVAFLSRHGIDVPRCNCHVQCPAFGYDASLVQRNVTAAGGRFILAAIRSGRILKTL